MLIYPLPVEGSSGLHAFCDLGGRVRFGPDVEWVDKADYTVDAARAKSTEEAVRRYWPGLPAGALQPDYCGIRPKIARGSPYDIDFMIQDARTHKIPNLINLYGIESPGLTSSLAIGDYVAALLEQQNDLSFITSITSSSAPTAALTGIKWLLCDQGQRGVAQLYEETAPRR